MTRTKKLLISGLMLGAMTLLACGAADRPGGGGADGGGTVGCPGGCNRGFSCQASTCTLDPTENWVLRLTSGTVAARKANGDTWDGDGSPPEPKVCLTINGIRACTPAIQDTYSPVWNTTFPAVTATALQAGVLAEYIDEDIVADDPICSGSIPVTKDEFQSGIWGFRCTSGVGQVNATLTAQ